MIPGKGRWLILTVYETAGPVCPAWRQRQSQGMKTSEESKLKAEIDTIVKRINTIIKNIDELDPAKEKATEEKKELPANKNQHP